jgi:c(7)-type cytochrome triheme protein
MSGSVKPFPPLASFDVAFDHAAHVSAAGGPRAGCATCHTPSRGGIALSIPSGAFAHDTCFRCHTARAQSGERDISSCGVCHRQGTRARMAPASSVAFARSFDHSAHGRAGLTCTECHAIRSGATAAHQVSAPVPEMHHAPARSRSCASCHDGTRAFGGTDFTACARCHKGDSWRF